MVNSNWLTETIGDHCFPVLGKFNKKSKFTTVLRKCHRHSVRKTYNDSFIIDLYDFDDNDFTFG